MIVLKGSQDVLVLLGGLRGVAKPAGHIRQLRAQVRLSRTLRHGRALVPPLRHRLRHALLQRARSDGPQVRPAQQRVRGQDPPRRRHRRLLARRAGARRPPRRHERARGERSRHGRPEQHHVLERRGRRDAHRPRALCHQRRLEHLRQDASGRMQI